MMASSLWKVDSRTFMRLFVVFNVSLAVYNFLSFRISNETRSPVAPCVLVVNSADQNQGAYVVVPNSSSSTDSLDPDQASEASLTTHSNRVPQLVKRETEIAKRGQYFVLANYVPANRTYAGDQSVTLTTQGTYNFLKHAVILCRRWDGPMSISVYVGSGGRELTRSLKAIGHLRRCHECVFQNVSWHLIFESDGVWHLPRANSTGFDSRPLRPGTKVPVWLDADATYNCSAMESVVYPKNVSREAPRKVGRGYPINVARNVARTMARTRFVMASDIELYPSPNIIPRFLRLVAQESADDKARQANKGSHVYVLPIFEVPKTEPPPENKTTLVRLLKENKAIYFHKWTCDACQNFPGRPTWPNSIPGQDQLGVHVKTKRDRSRNSWEPIYIGTNADPLYEEGLSWEGKRDKMSQMFEMCLMNYTLYVLDNAFLVHAPGIKTINNIEEKRRGPFMSKNNMVYQRTMAQIKKKYPHNKLNC